MNKLHILAFRYIALLELIAIAKIAYWMFQNTRAYAEVYRNCQKCAESVGLNWWLCELALNKFEFDLN